MDMLTLEVLAAQHPRKPITTTGSTFIHASCALESSQGLGRWVIEATDVFYGLVTGRQCFLCSGPFEE